jgi:hypothetical protein
MVSGSDNFFGIFSPTGYEQILRGSSPNESGKIDNAKHLRDDSPISASYFSSRSGAFMAPPEA